MVAFEPWQIKHFKRSAPWVLDGISICEWIARQDGLASLVVPPAAEPFAYRGMADHPPNEPAVYFLLAESGGVLYIGKATQLASRLDAHFKADLIPFHGVQWRLLPVEAAEVLEAYLIERLAPPYNVKFCCRMRAWSRELAEALEANEVTR